MALTPIEELDLLERIMKARRGSIQKANLSEPISTLKFDYTGNQSKSVEDTRKGLEKFSEDLAHGASVTSSAFKEGLLAYNPFSLGIDLLSSPLGITEPVGGSQWISKRIEKTKPATKTEELVKNIAEQSGMFLGSLPAGELLTTMGLPTVGTALSDITAGQALKIAAKAGAGQTAGGIVGEEIGGETGKAIGELGGMIAGPLAIQNPLKVGKGIVNAAKALGEEGGALKLGKTAPVYETVDKDEIARILANFDDTVVKAPEMLPQSTAKTAIFADWDGVFNTANGGVFDKKAISAFNDMLPQVKEPGIVISSDHRLTNSLEELTQQWQAAGGKGRIIGVTGKNPEGRTAEINEWMNTFGKEAGVEKYIAFDDAEDLSKLGTSFIQVNPTTGITANEIKLALRSLLGNETGSITTEPLIEGSLWDKAIGKKLSQIETTVGNAPLLPKNWKIAQSLGGRSIREWALSPQLRMDVAADKLFERTLTESERIGGAAREAGMLARNLNFSQTEDLARVLKSNFDITKARPKNREVISKIISSFENSKLTTKEKLYPVVEQERLIDQELTKRLTTLFAEDFDDPLWQLKKASAKEDLSTPKGTKKFLDNILTDPLVSNKIKTIARDLYDLPAKTAVEVADAHRHSYESLLISQLKENPDWVLPQVKFMRDIKKAHKGGVPDTAELKKIEQEISQFVEIPHNPEFEGLLVQKDIAEGIKDLDQTITGFRKNYNRYFLNPWKFQKIGLQVPARFRDFYGNIMFNDIAGQFPLSPYRIDIYGSALKDMQAAKRGMIPPELEEFFKWSGGKVDAINSISTDPIFAAMRHDANPLDQILGLMYNNKLSKFSAEAMKTTDLWAKYAKFKWNLKNGMEGEDAAIDAIRAVGDHTKQSRAVRLVRDTAMPFFGWQAHALRQIANGFTHHPVRTAKWFLAPVLAAQYSIEKLGMTQEEYQSYLKVLPDYLKQTVAGIPTHIPVPYRDEKGRIQMMDVGWWTPGLQDLSELDQNVSNPIRFMQNPSFTIGAALYSNKKFSGAPIHNEWDSPGTKVAKIVGYLGEQLLSPLTPGVGNHWKKIYNAFNENNSDALTIQQALLTQVGGKITPIDEAKQAKKYRTKFKAMRREAKTQMKKEVRKAWSPEDQEKIITDYYDTLERLRKEERGE